MLKETVTYNGVEYDLDDVYQRRLFVTCVEPTNYEEYQYCNIFALHGNKKDGAIGRLPKRYLSDLDHLEQFQQFKPFFSVMVTATTLTDRKNQDIERILEVDFDSVIEYDLQIKVSEKPQPQSNKPKPQPQSQPQPQSNKPKSQEDNK